MLPHNGRLLCTSKSGNTLESNASSSLEDFSRKSEKTQRNLDFLELWKVVFQIEGGCIRCILCKHSD